MKATQKSATLRDVAHRENSALFGRALGRAVDPDELRKELPFAFRWKLKLLRKATKLGLLGATRVPG